MKTQELYCIVCPNGCKLTVAMEGDAIKEVTGGKCKRGEKYAVEELKNPQRVLTSTVKIENCDQALLPVRSSETISKSLLLDAMKQINKVKVKAPISLGDVIIKNILNTGVDIVAEKSIR